MSSKTKNSGSGPKNASSAIPSDLIKSSAFFATDLGSFSYPFPSLGSTISHLNMTRGSSEKTSRTLVLSSGMRIMSDSLIGFQPAMEEPSNIFPSEKKLSSTVLADTVTCWSLPLVSVKRRSTHSAFESAISFKVFFDIKMLQLN